MQTPKSLIKEVREKVAEAEALAATEGVHKKELKALQKKLDSIDTQLRQRDYKSEDLHLLFELQALIFGQEGKDTEADEFLQEAIKSAGGIQNLESDFLKDYASLNEFKYEGEPEFFVRPRRNVFVLMLATFGTYAVYWFYQNWKAVQLSQEKKIRPIWRSLFSVIWALPLFKIMLGQAQKKHNKTLDYSAANMAGIYATTMTAVYGIALLPKDKFPAVAWAVMIAFLAIAALLIANLQSVINSTKTEGETKTVTWSIWEGIALIVGTLLIVVVTVKAFAPENPVNDADTSSKKSELESLTSQYNLCSGDLKTRQLSLDTTNLNAVNAYNSDVVKCEEIRTQQNKAVDDYNKSLSR